MAAASPGRVKGGHFVSRLEYVVLITEGVACATLQVSSVLVCPTKWGCVSALSPDLFARACVVTSVEGMGSSRTRHLCLDLGTSFSCDSHLSSYTTAQAIV
jgi:hypothetical protein